MAHRRAPDAHDPFLCAMCRQRGVRCTGCKEVHYCSKQCQKSDWPIHKLVCKTNKEFSLDKRPGTDYKRGILFPEDGEQPHFIWVKFAHDNKDPLTKCTWVGGDEDDELQSNEGSKAPVLGAYLGSVQDYSQGVILNQYENPVLNRQLAREVRIFGKFRTAELHDAFDNHKLNQSLLKIDRELQEVWYGNIVVCGQHEAAGEPTEIYDLSLMDLRHVVDLPRFYYDNRKREIQEQTEGETVEGVRIACAPDHDIHFDRIVEPISVSKSLCDAKSDISAPLTDSIGIPLVFRRLPLSLTWRDRNFGFPGMRIGQNPHLHNLNPDITLCDSRHGVGSAIAVRKDGKPLLEAHMWAFIEYGHSHICVCHASSCSHSVGQPHSREHFMAWYTPWIAGKIAEGLASADTPSPYDV